MPCFQRYLKILVYYIVYFVDFKLVVQLLTSFYGKNIKNCSASSKYSLRRFTVLCSNAVWSPFKKEFSRARLQRICLFWFPTFSTESVDQFLVRISLPGCKEFIYFDSRRSVVSRMFQHIIQSRNLARLISPWSAAECVLQGSPLNRTVNLLRL